MQIFYVDITLMLSYSKEEILRLFIRYIERKNSNRICEKENDYIMDKPFKINIPAYFIRENVSIYIIKIIIINNLQ